MNGENSFKKISGDIFSQNLTAPYRQYRFSIPLRRPRLRYNGNTETPHNTLAFFLSTLTGQRIYNALEVHALRC